MTRPHPDLRSDCPAQGSVSHDYAVLVSELEQGQGTCLALPSLTSLESITHSTLQLWNFLKETWKIHLLNEFQSQRNSRFLHKIPNQNFQNLWNNSGSGETGIAYNYIKNLFDTYCSISYLCLLYILGVWAFSCFVSVLGFFCHVK